MTISMSWRLLCHDPVVQLFFFNLPARNNDLVSEENAAHLRI
jgi:hypothetical protein